LLKEIGLNGEALKVFKLNNKLAIDELGELYLRNKLNIYDESIYLRFSGQENFFESLTSKEILKCIFNRKNVPVGAYKINLIEPLINDRRFGISLSENDAEVTLILKGSKINIFRDGSYDLDLIRCGSIEALVALKDAWIGNVEKFLSKRELDEIVDSYLY